MPFNNVISGGDKTTIRSESAAVEAYMLYTPIEVVWQAKVKTAKTNENYATVEWELEQSGTRTDCIKDMLVVIGDSASDFTGPTLWGRLRTTPDATLVYIGEDGKNLTVGQYITVLNDFPLIEKLGRVSGGGFTYKDYDDTYVPPPATISGISPVYADLSGAATVTWALAPTVTATASGDSVSGYLWDVDDGSITVGTTTTKDITVEFPDTKEFRWIHLTVTTTGGTSLTFHIQVFTVDKMSTAGTALKLDHGPLNLTYDLESGWSGDVTVTYDFAATQVLDGTRITLVLDATYDLFGTPVTDELETNILLVGYLHVETGSLDVDEAASAVTEVALPIVGVGGALANVRANRQHVEDSSAPAAWGQMTNPTPTRVIVQHLAYDTTFLSLFPFESDDLTAYIFDGGALTIQAQNALDNVNYLAEVVNAAAEFASDGTLSVRTNANYLSTSDRAALDTIYDFDFNLGDYVSLPTLNREHKDRFGQAELVGAVYNTTTNDVSVTYVANAPPVSFGSGFDTARLNGQILTADATAANAQAELAQRTANHLAYVNRKWSLTALLPLTFHWLQPSSFQWHTHALPAETNTRARVFTASDRWLLVGLDITIDNVENVADIEATWESETQDTAAGIQVDRIPVPGDSSYDMPVDSAFPQFPDDFRVMSPTDNVVPGLFVDDSWDPSDPVPPGHDMTPPPNGEVLSVSMKTGAIVQTTRLTASAATYIIRAEGYNTIDDVGSDYDFQGSTEGFSINGGYGTFTSSGIEGAQVGGSGPVKVDAGKTESVALNATSVNLVYSSTGLSEHDSSVIVWLGSTKLIEVDLPAEGSNVSIQASGFDVTDTDILIQFDTGLSPAGGGQITIHTLEFGGVAVDGFGDAFYQWSTDEEAQLYASGKGLLVGGLTPSGFGPYNESHVYEWLHTGDGFVESFQWIDPDGDYTDNDNNNLRITIIGPNMGIV